MFISVGIISDHYPFQNFVHTFHRFGKWVFCAMGNSMQFDRGKVNINTSINLKGLQQHQDSKILISKIHFLEVRSFYERFIL